MNDQEISFDEAMELHLASEIARVNGDFKAAEVLQQQSERVAIAAKNREETAKLK